MYWTIWTDFSWQMHFWIWMLGDGLAHVSSPYCGKWSGSQISLHTSSSAIPSWSCRIWWQRKKKIPVWENKERQPGFLCSELADNSVNLELSNGDLHTVLAQLTAVDSASLLFSLSWLSQVKWLRTCSALCQWPEESLLSSHLPFALLNHIPSPYHTVI